MEKRKILLQVGFIVNELKDRNLQQWSLLSAKKNISFLKKSMKF
jgi:hypothetical protein